MDQGKYVTPRKAAKQLGVCLATLRRWKADGKIGAIRTPGGQRRYCIEQYQQETKPTVLYARVSTYSQKDDLARQAEFLLKAYPEGELVKEVGSGLNFKRRKFLSILESIYKGDVGCLVCAYPTHPHPLPGGEKRGGFGFPLVEWICKTDLM